MRADLLSPPHSAGPLGVVCADERLSETAATEDLTLVRCPASTSHHLNDPLRRRPRK